MTFAAWKTFLTVYFYASQSLTPNAPAIDLSDYKNKVLLVVNVATEWGLTATNYKELNELHTKYNSKGLEIIAQPCNQFGKQEPLSGVELHDHIKTKFNPKFMHNFFAKKDVNGEGASELFLFLQNHENTSGMITNSIKWNFTKFLVGRDGVPLKRYAPTTNPLSFEDDIIEALGIENELK